MLDNFIISIRAILPLFFMMMLGALVRKKGWLNLPELPRLNGMIFKALFPFTVFLSLYKTDLTHAFHPGLIAFSVIAVLVTILLSLWLVPKIEPSKRSQGAMIQGIYRSNFVLLGLPLTASLYPGADLGMTAIVIAVLIPVYNVSAVLILECYRGERPNPKRILRSVLTNPLILGCVAGLLCIPFDLPDIADQTISQLGAAAIPMALILLGASFQLQHSSRLRRNLRIVVTCRLIIVPGIFLTLAALLGFRDMAFVTLLGVFSAPCSVSSFTMAQQMDSDGELSGATVVYTSLLSCATMFLWTFLFKQLGIF